MVRPIPDDPLRLGDWMDDLETADALPLELAACKATPQPATHHAEGDVYRHIRLAVASLPAVAEKLALAPTLDRAVAVMCHDIGKAPCWNPVDQNFYRHDSVGAEMVAPFLERIDPGGRVDRERVAWCVREHLFWLHADLDLVRDAPVARRYCRPDGWGDDLRVVNLCDGLASWGPGGPNVRYLEAVQRKIDEVRRRVAEEAARPKPVLTGHDVMGVLGIPPGPAVGDWLRRLAQTGITDPAAAREWLRARASSSTAPGHSS